MGTLPCCTDDPTKISQPLYLNTNSNLQKDSITHLSKAVDCLFRKYDKDNSGTLDRREVTQIIGAALADMGMNRRAKREEITALVEKSDVNKDGKICKEELLKLFKKIAKC